MHARRDFIGAAQRHPELQAWSERWLKRFAGLYTRNARRLAHFKRPVAMSAQPAAFVAAHRRLKRKVVELFETAKRELHGLPDDSPKAPALRALVREREGLSVFVDSPATPMDNNASERALRAPAISRKVSFGSHSETGARLSAVCFRCSPPSPWPASTAITGCSIICTRVLRMPARRPLTSTPRVKFCSVQG